MRVWIIQDGEPIPGIDENTRDWRAAMLAKAFVARGHEVLWWASTFDHARKRHRFDAPRTVELQPGLTVRLLHGPGYSHNKSPKRFWHHRALAAAYARESASRPPPALLFCSIPTLELAEQSVIYGRKRHVPVVVDVRDAWPDHYLSMAPVPLRGLVRLLLFTEFRRAYRIFGNVTGISAISDVYLNWGLKYARRGRCPADGVFPMGYPVMAQSTVHGYNSLRDEFMARYGIDNSQLVLAFVGSFTTAFDLITVIEAARLLSRTKKVNTKFVVVGEGDQRNKLLNQAAGLNNVIFTGWFDQASVSAILGLASVGLAPYCDDSVISLPNKPFEYMAAGLPLLSSLPGELERLIGQYQIGLHYRAGDVQSLVEKIVWLAEHPEERIAMGQRARKLFEEQFRADIIYPKLVDHLEKVATNAALTGIKKSLV